MSRLDDTVPAANEDQEKQTVGARSDGAQLAHQVCAFLRRFVVLTSTQATALALWAMHTHAISAVDVTPYVHITSATKRAGKTRLLEVLSLLVSKPWLTGRASAAVLVRKVDHDRPTLLLDETDAAFGQQNEYSESLRGILNSGYKRNGTASLCVPVKGSYVAKDFKTFCPKALAGIQDIPDTVADRSIRIELRRKRSNEPVERFQTRKADAEASTVRRQLEDWAERNIPSLTQAEATVLESLNDRAFEIWEPLLCIADLLGARWPDMAREAAHELAGVTEDADQGVQLLEDTRDYVEGVGTEFVGTTELLQHLNGLEDRPYRDLRGGTGLTGSQLARKLKPFGIIPGGPTRQGSTVRRGYRTSSFQDAFTRYLQPLQRNNPNVLGHGTAPANRNTQAACNGLESVTGSRFPDRSNAVTPDGADEGDILEPPMTEDVLNSPALGLLLQLEGAGLRVQLRDDDTVTVAPRSALSALQYEQLFVYRDHLRALLRVCDSGVQDRTAAFKRQLASTPGMTLPNLLYRSGQPYVRGILLFVRCATG